MSAFYSMNKEGDILAGFDQILTQEEITQFDSPPTFNDKQLETLFRLPDEAEEHLRTLRSAVSKLSFIMQFAYCQSTNQFYPPSTYHDQHILKAIRLRGQLRELSGLKKKAELRALKEKLGGNLLNRHRKACLDILNLSEIDDSRQKELESFAAAQAKKQMGPESLLHLLVSEIRRRRWLIPSVRKLNSIISQHYAEEEKTQLEIIGRHLSEEGELKLLELLEENEQGYYKLLYFKKINQSTSPRDLQSNAKIMTHLHSIYESCNSAISVLKLNEQAVAYFSRWVNSSDNSDIAKVSDRKKVCLYLIGFIIQQLFERQDAAVDGFNKRFLKYLNKAKSDSEKARLKYADKQTELLESVAKSKNELLSQMKIWIEVGQDTSLSTEFRLTKILTGLIDLVNGGEDIAYNKSQDLNNIIEAKRSRLFIYEELLKNSDSIIKALSTTLKSLIFDEEYSDSHLFNAIRSFQQGKSIKTSFLSTSQRRLLDLKPEMQGKLLKIFLFEAVVNGFKSGSLNLKYTFVWKSIERLLKGGVDWQSKLSEWLSIYGLSEFRYFQSVRERLTNEQDKLLERVNYNKDAELNPYVVITEKGKLKLKSYDADSEKNQPNTISEMLYEVEKLSVKDVIQTIQGQYNFMQNFVHKRNRNVSRAVDEKLMLASIIALGCNIGPRAMIKCSEGISDSSLLTTIEHRMTPDNLRRANQFLTEKIENLSLSAVFQFDANTLHSSSDGQKLHVDGESLMASRSFKYFGSESGITRYPFVDERHRMLDTFVFSAALREATYVLDGLVGNLGEKRMHSTDTHGYTDALFGVTNVIGIQFAPRIKGIERLGLYGTRSISQYKKNGYLIRPTSNIQWSKIEPYWNDILRLVITILSGKASASQIFRRLNSYSKNPLYTALKEFGRIAKTNFVLEYIDNLEFRQRIQKQLNLGEQANSFFKAVFWARGHRLRINRTGDEERYLLSAQLIQNCVVLWNYLYVTNLLAQLPPGEERNSVIQQIRLGQMLAWGHVNFSGEFDFRKKKVPLISFDVPFLEGLQFDSN